MKKAIKGLVGSLCAIVMLIMCFPTLIVIADTESDEPTRQDPNGPVTKRALVISAPIEPGVPEADSRIMQRVFSDNGIHVADDPYFQPRDGALSLLYTKITSTFASADQNDISYVYITCHGYRNTGLYVCGRNSNTYLTMAALRARLDLIYGTVVLMIDSCNAGMAIRSEEEETSASDDSLSDASFMIQQFMECDGDRSGEFNGQTKYVVLCACGKYQSSNLGSGSQYYGKATRAWAYCAGLNPSSSYPYGTIRDWSEYSPANDVLTVEEYFYYSNQRLQMYLPNDQDQDMCYYAASPYFSIFFDDYRLGDINRDHYINTKDELQLRNHMAETIVLTGRPRQLADLTQDGNINMQDLLALRQYIVAV